MQWWWKGTTPFIIILVRSPEVSFCFWWFSVLPQNHGVGCRGGERVRRPSRTSRRPVHNLLQYGEGCWFGLAQELCESRGGWMSWAPVPDKPTVSVDVKQHFYHQLQRICAGEWRALSDELDIVRYVLLQLAGERYPLKAVRTLDKTNVSLRENPCGSLRPFSGSDSILYARCNQPYWKPHKTGGVPP